MMSFASYRGPADKDTVTDGNENRFGHDVAPLDALYTNNAHRAVDVLIHATRFRLVV